MRAIVLAGGKGTRLRPYTTVIPKPLMPIGEYPILEVVVIQLAQYGFDHVTIAVNHQAELIKAFFNDGKKWGVKIDYSIETKPLGTIGPLRLLKDLPEDFLVMNGDVLSDLDLAGFLNKHTRQGTLLSVGCAKRLSKFEYGVLESDAKGHITGFQEKPTQEYKANMGIYALNRRVVDLIPSNQTFGFDDLMKKIMASSTKTHLHLHEGYWLDIGKPDDYVQAIEEFDVMKPKLIKTNELITD